MQITYKTEGDYVKGINAECSPIEWLLISTGLELIADNPNLGIKDRRLAKDMIISVKDHDRLCKALDNEGVIDKIRAEIEQLPTVKCTETHRIYIDAADFKENVLAILDKHKERITE